MDTKEVELMKPASLASLQAGKRVRHRNSGRSNRKCGQVLKPLIIAGEPEVFVVIIGQ